MKTRCPDCQTVFRVTAEQLKARAGTVRCGHCQVVFNGLDNLLDEQNTVATIPHAPAPLSEIPAQAAPFTEKPETTTEQPENSSFVPEHEEEPSASVAEEIPPDAEEFLDSSTTQEIGKAAGLILPRETSEIPGYSKWAEGVVTPPLFLPEEKPSHRLFSLAAVLLVLGLAGQMVFYYRSELAVTLPSLRPLLESFSQILDSPLPLPAHAELVSIETSDLQTDAARGNLLVLNATLRNRAAYGQAYPSLELSLTDTQDAAIARKVFGPKDYLPGKFPADQPFAANSDIPIRLWIETRDLSAAGYRLFVFYP